LKIAEKEGKTDQRVVIQQQTIAAIASLLSNDMNLDLQERACAASVHKQSAVACDLMGEF